VKRYLLEKKQDNFSVVEFGLEGRRVAKQDLEYFESRLDPEARRIVWLSEVKRAQGGALALWNEILDKLVADASSMKDAGSEHCTKHMVHLSLNLEAIEGLKGVSTNCLSGGISTEDAVEMCYQAGLKLGRAAMLTSVDISEFNPYVED